VEPEIVDTTLSLLEKLAGKEKKPYPTAETHYTKVVRADKPFAYWRMNNIDGISCPDSVKGEKRAGTYSSLVAYWLEGPDFSSPGGEKQYIPAVQFAGGYAKGHLEGLPQDYSFETWVWNGLDPDNRPVTGYIFSRGKSVLQPIALFPQDQPLTQTLTGDHLGIGGTHNDSEAQNRLFLYNGDEQKQMLIGKTEIPLKKWTHIVFTRKGDQVSLYVNGELDVRGEIPCTYVINEPTVWVGNRSDLLYGLEGKLAEAAFYDRVLTAGEVKIHWNAAKKK
jgi:hypothetical protein